MKQKSWRKVTALGIILAVLPVFLKDWLTVDDF